MNDHQIHKWVDDERGEYAGYSCNPWGYEIGHCRRMMLKIVGCQFLSFSLGEPDGPSKYNSFQEFFVLWRLSLVITGHYCSLIVINGY